MDMSIHRTPWLGFSTSLQGLLGCGGFGTVELWEHKGGEFWTPWGTVSLWKKRETFDRQNATWIYLNNLNTTLLGVLPPQIVRVSPHPGLTLGCVPKILYLLAERYNVWIPVTWAPGNGDTYALKGLSKAASWVNQGMAEADETPKQILQNRSKQMTEIWKQMKARRWLIFFWFRVPWVLIFEPYTIFFMVVAHEGHMVGCFHRNNGGFKMPRMPKWSQTENWVPKCLILASDDWTRFRWL